MKTRTRVFWYNDELRKVLSRVTDEVDAEYRARAKANGFVECSASMYKTKSQLYYFMDNRTWREKRRS